MPLLLLFILGASLSGCSRIEEPGKTAETVVQLPDQEIWNGTIEITQNGLTQSVVQAGHIDIFEKQKITRLDSGVVVDFFDKKGQHASVLTSERARIEEKQNLFFAEGNVIVRSDSGEVLRTERLYWDRQNRLIRSDTLVTMTTEYDSLRGFEFESKEDLSSWQLQKPTGMTFRKIQK